MRFAETLSRRLHRWARGGVIAALVAAFVAFQVVVLPRLTALPGGDVTSLDARVVYGAGDIAEVAAAYGDAIPVWIAVYFTWDLVNPVAYAAILALAISWAVARGPVARSERGRRLNLLPVGAALFDLLENVTIAAILALHPATVPGLTGIAVAATLGKFALLGASALVLVAAVVALAFARRAPPEG